MYEFPFSSLTRSAVHSLCLLSVWVYTELNMSALSVCRSWLAWLCVCGWMYALSHARISPDRGSVCWLRGGGARCSMTVFMPPSCPSFISFCLSVIIHFDTAPCFSVLFCGTLTADPAVLFTLFPEQVFSGVFPFPSLRIGRVGGVR